MKKGHQKRGPAPPFFILIMMRCIRSGSIRSFWCQIVRLFAETYPHRCIRTYQLDFSFVSSLSLNGNTSTITSFPYYISNREIAPSLQPDCSAECMVFSSSQPIALFQYYTKDLCSCWFWYNRKSPLRGKRWRKRLKIRASEAMRWLWKPYLYIFSFAATAQRYGGVSALRCNGFGIIKKCGKIKRLSSPVFSSINK